VLREVAAIMENLSPSRLTKNTCLRRPFVARITIEQESQEHLCNVSADENFVLVRHKKGPKDSLLKYLYGVQVVAGSNPVAPIDLETALLGSCYEPWGASFICPLSNSACTASTAGVTTHRG
jgi:hypothetical protein